VDVHLNTELLYTAVALAVRQYQAAKGKGLRQVIVGGFKEHIIGLEGAFAVAAYVFGNWLTGLDTVAIGKADEGDLIFKDGRIADVKTRAESWHDKLMIPRVQFERHNYDLYIGCSEVAEDTIRIWGYITREDAERHVKEIGWESFGHGDTLAVPFGELCDIRKLKREITR
jgi:hypothetical protein